LTALGEAYGLTAETGDGWYPAWPPNKDSALLAQAVAVYKDVYKESYATNVIHAGLECGWIVSRYGDMDCIAIGPTIQNPHTTSERLDTKSVKPFYLAVKALLKSRFEAQKSAAR
jgi:dipeptidase D